MSIQFGPVFPVLPSYLPTGSLDCGRTAAYVRYLQANGAKSIMTTSGTSQFNLLTTAEILELNSCVADTFKGRTILGAPPLADVHLTPFLAQTTSRHSEAELLLCYPERWYCQSDVIEFFGRISRMCPGVGIHIHGLPMRSAHGGTQDFTGAMLLRIIEKSCDIIGMKEECSSYENGFNLCSVMAARPNFELIVAGGSMRRFLLLHAAGAQSFFAGVGSLFPSIELAYYEHIVAGRLKEASLIISAIETPLFATFMDVGWHKALRYAAKRLGLLGEGERWPVAAPSAVDINRIEESIKTLETQMKTLHHLLAV